MIDAAALSRMRPGAFLINCARAGLVDHHALGRALRAGHLGGCALDVLPDEPPSADQPALSWSRTPLSPHAAWFYMTSDLGQRPFPRPKLSPDGHLWLAWPQPGGRAAAAVARRQAVTAAGADGG